MLFLLNLLLTSSFVVTSIRSHGCPYMNKKLSSQKQSVNKNIEEIHKMMYYEAINSVNFDDVKSDLITLMHTSQTVWPSDYDNYGPFFIRLAWHCSGSYRQSDGRGGCDGGRQRFDPEQSWQDNTNLDKARSLLWPIKEKYGLGLSWGDLFILAGTTAIEDMGGPVLGFCAGRIDDSDGFESIPLGPTEYQSELYPCELDGNCSAPLGATTLGLIYVNPEGHMGNPIPEDSVYDIRNVFARMGMNDTETVALIGGGHAFGKTHGACPKGAGSAPNVDPENPWPGLCGTGKGNDTFTSGFEGSWTDTPTKWSNDYFKNLLKYHWKSAIGPGGHYQWFKNETNNNTMMLTTDIALTRDESYLNLVHLYANDIDALNEQFKHAWYKLTTRDMGPVTRCMGNDVPPAQPFQYPLPDPLPVNQLADFNAVKKSIQHVIHTPNNAILVPDKGGYGPLFVRLAWQCANTYRNTDYMGGCNGARIRYAPQIDWSANSKLDAALELLQPVKDQYGDSLSWADLIVLSGNVALEEANPNLTIPFVGGRTDSLSTDEPTPSFLENRLNGGDEDDTIDVMNDVMYVWGLTPRELVALIGGGHSIGRMHEDVSGFINGSWTVDPTVFDNEYFSNLLNLNWTIQNPNTNLIEYKAMNDDGYVLYMLKTDLNLKFDPEYKAIAEEYVQDKNIFYTEFINSWVKIMNADLYNQTTSNVITTDDEDNDNSSDNKTTLSMTVIIIMSALLSLFGGLVLGVGSTYWYFHKNHINEKHINEDSNIQSSSSIQQNPIH